MTTVNVYLNFDGNCKAAFDFYKSVFGGDFGFVGTYADMPSPDESTLSDEDKAKIMHISLPISKETIIMGSDSVGDWAPQLQVGNNFAISVSPRSREEADILFNGLAKGGQVNMPLSDAFWGAYFGTLTDQFGINWMINYENPQNS